MLSHLGVVALADDAEGSGGAGQRAARSNECGSEGVLRGTRKDGEGGVIES